MISLYQLPDEDAGHVYIIAESADDAITVWRRTTKCPPTQDRNEFLPLFISILPILNAEDVKVFVYREPQ